MNVYAVPDLLEERKSVADQVLQLLHTNLQEDHEYVAEVYFKVLGHTPDAVLRVVIMLHKTV